MIAIAATLVGGVHGFAGAPQSSRGFARNVSPLGSQLLSIGLQ
jgi:hypothetical protein